MTSKNLKTRILSHFFIALILDGLQRLNGLFTLELLHSVNTNRQNAVLPFTTSWAVANIVASFSGILIPSTKSERIILLGVLLTAVGAALCSLTTNITTLTVLWGFIFGSGYGLSSPHLSQYLKSINFTSSLLQATPNLGAAIMPFIFHIVVSHYELQSSYLILSGIILHYLPLFLAAAYNIELPVPNIKWRVRKRNTHYIVSKQDVGKTIFNESFINSLESDLISTVSQSTIQQDDIKTNSRSSEELPSGMIHINRKRSETRGNDLQSLSTNIRMLPQHSMNSQIVKEIKSYEKGRRVFEGSFNHGFIYEDDENMEDNESKELQDKNNGDQTCYFERDLERNDTNNQTEEITDRKSSAEKLKLSALKENKISIDKNQETVNICSEESKKSSSIAATNAKPVNDILENIIEETDGNNTATEEKLEKQNFDKMVTTKNFSGKTSHPIISPVSENSKRECKQFINETVITIPVDIKVHVVECFMSDDEYWKANWENKQNKNNSYRKHSNSVLPGMYDNIDLTELNCSKSIKKSVKYGNKLSNIYTISKGSEFDEQNKASLKQKEKEHKSDIYTMSKIKQGFKFLNEITTPICVCIILITITFEFNIVTLLSIFADFGNDIDNDCLDFKSILVSFGVGGLIGKICCCKISRTIPEKSHTIGVILFLLIGISTAGVLFSPNLYWLAGFYCILGALEGGITYTIPKFIMEHTSKNLHSKLSSVKNFLSGIAVASIPYVIGLSRDSLGDYEFLLQILSCSSVFCAVLAYFLPHLSKTYK